MILCHAPLRRALLALFVPLAITALGSCDTPAGSQATTQTTTSAAPNQAAQTSRAPATLPAPTSARDPHSGLRWIARSELPPEGREMLRLIARGGPFRYSRDGAAFGNRERLLPQAERGYYREYTVRTPGESDRGARRLVCGRQSETTVAECYYTADHYASFRRVRP
ncbi:ribonuclease domain-containing protein [Deinococcus deserti]|uniref:Putative ribonuclease SA n=1 Tax=Deinococcus deserti (strain DSM 17065 / CIP 109153 / LMG 22923 / VCD115) TaxID=546414 RepID=C1CVN4_DEIDV|nr:ribonuclease domain-containing protein [Deinococcus deserti]ACO46251.1 putative ribonuclease SA [Deinococcus deserti VCD115]